MTGKQTRARAAAIANQLTMEEWTDIACDDPDLESVPPPWTHDHYEGVLVESDGDVDCDGRHIDCSVWTDTARAVVEYVREFGRHLVDVERECLTGHGIHGPAHLVAASRLVRLRLMRQIAVRESADRVAVQLVPTTLGFAVAQYLTDVQDGATSRPT